MKAGQIWGRKNRAEVIILNPTTGRYLLATVNAGQKSMTGAQLAKALAGYKQSGNFPSLSK